MGDLKTLEENNVIARAQSVNVAPHPADNTAFVIQQKNKFPYRGFVEIEVSGVKNFLMFCNNDDPVALHYFWLGANAWEPFAVSIWVKLLSMNNGNILDVGSFSGLYSLISAGIGERDVYAVEASRMPIGRLLDNINCNGYGKRIHVVPKALSDYKGNAEFSLRREIGTISTGGSLKHLGGRTELVEVSTLDSEFLGKFGRVGLMKIDVEGAELQVLAGGRGLIETDRPFILIEIKSAELMDVLEVFGELNYKGNLLSERERRLVDINTSIETTENYLFYPSDFNAQQLMY